uniref:Secreted protein n=1 Tax=Ascaris lumbricoides TaxID=6252 RepID=A0A0M3IL46_ASCLU
MMMASLLRQWISFALMLFTQSICFMRLFERRLWSVRLCERLRARLRSGSYAPIMWSLRADISGDGAIERVVIT